MKKKRKHKKTQKMYFYNKIIKNMQKLKKKERYF